MFGEFEKNILSFWKARNIFGKSVDNRRKGKRFVFFEGPPTANGRPGVHHVESRSFKDVILRYKTMRGYFVPRRAGWDTHGLPVEVEVEKELGLKSKKDIEEFGVSAFNKKCRESVWRYKELWERLTEKMGFWIDMENPYVTYDNGYMESLWAIIKEFAKKKLLYEDYKVMPWCARCGTALSSHELAQGYSKVKEDSIYVKFPLIDQFNVYFLIWTTTPWTLPGNVALAVNPKVDYVFVKKDDETLILAEALLNKLGGEYMTIKKVKGKELVGASYGALYQTSGLKHTAYVVAGDFVSTEDGTGIVHIAPAFGDDDFQLSRKYKLPVLVSTAEDGSMNTPGKSWHGKFFKAADRLIVEDLKKRQLLFKTESHEHDYPFCWRCKTPLMYLARKTWWVDVNKVRKNLIANNKTVNWLPSHIKEGRFGEWLKEKKNWAFSRERYWGTPLPVWRCESCGQWEAIGSIEELQKRSPSSGNKYILMRHGEAESNVKNIVSASLADNVYDLTLKGKKEAQAAASALKKKKLKPDLIFASPLLRTKKTAEIVAGEFNLEEKVNLETRISEVNTGVFAEGHPKKYHEYFKSRLEKFSKPPPGGETLAELKRRVWELIGELEAKHQNKTILIVSHEYVLWMLWTAMLGKSNEEAVAAKGDDFVDTGKFVVVDLPSIPRDENLVLDLHKPYVDQIKLKCGCGEKKMQRVKEVVDVWFDSGSMPWASHAAYPADYISEAVDQTRGWFYTLLAVGTLLGKKAPYKNVISLGHVLDEKGKKMSKSLGNVVEPVLLIEKYGADAVRWYFFTVNQPWDSKLFKEDDLKDAQRRFFNILLNSFEFWKLYGGKKVVSKKLKVEKAKLLINQWVLVLFNKVAGAVTRKLDSYDVVGAARELENFVTEDLSRWYIRRIRDVIKDDSAAAKETGEVLRFVLLEISKLLAPFAPFSAEHVYKELGGKAESVHLENWTASKKPKTKDQNILNDMAESRRVVSLALEARASAGIKVRQPLGKLAINKKAKKLGGEFSELIKAEVNVKNVEYADLGDKEVELDTYITPGLKEEGIYRDLAREVQAARKKAGLMPKDKVPAKIFAPDDVLYVADKFKKNLEKETNLKSLALSQADNTRIEFTH